MWIPEACGSEKDEGMTSAEDGIKSKNSVDLSQKRKGKKKYAHLSATARRKAMS